jgi:hypothetical protein
MRNNIVIGSTIAVGVIFGIVAYFVTVPDLVGNLMVASLIVPIGLWVK